jgi:hypothetical protein
MQRGENSVRFRYSAMVDGDSMGGTMTTPRGENPFTGVRK